MGPTYSVVSRTGSMAAALGAGSQVFGLRNSPTAANRILVAKIKLQWLVTTAFTAPVSAGRRLEFVRGSGAALAGGTAIAAAAKLNALALASSADSASGGDTRIATTGDLTNVGVTFETVDLGVFNVEKFGAANDAKEETFDFEDEPLHLAPGELLAITNPQAMDAAGVWQLGVSLQFREVNHADAKASGF